MCSSECGKNAFHSDGTVCASCYDAYLQAQTDTQHDQATVLDNLHQQCGDGHIFSERQPACMFYVTLEDYDIFNRSIWLTEASCSLSFLAHGSTL